MQNRKLNLKYYIEQYLCVELNYIDSLNVSRLTHKKQKRVCDFLFSKFFSMRAIFVQTLHMFLIYYSENVP